MKKPTIINKEQLQEQVNILEDNCKFDNLSAMWKSLEKTEWAKNYQPRPLKYNFLYAKAKELGVITKTQAGHKGVVKGEKRKKKSKRDFSEATIKTLNEAYPKLGGLVKRVIDGSMKAAIKLKCLDCCCQERQEVALCNIQACSLWMFRPYKEKT